jgi:hypothetical protein
MTELSVPIAQARRGVQISTNQTTHIQIRMATIEILVGGPYSGHPYGHTALRVTTSHDDKIYDYGRYGRTWGFGNSEGDGVLNIWKDFQAYIKGENSHNRVTTGFTYDVTEEKAGEINKFYESKVKGKKNIVSDKDYDRYIIEDYYALGPNCTTLSMSGAKIALPSIDKNRKTFQEGRGLSMLEKSAVSVKSWPDYIFMPADLKAMLEASDVKSKKINKYQ